MLIQGPIKLIQDPTDKALAVLSIVFAVGIPRLQAGEDVNCSCGTCRASGIPDRQRRGQ